MQETTVFQRQGQRISASDILQVLANVQPIELTECTISGTLDVNRLFVKEENFDISNLSVETDAGKRILTFSQQIKFDSCTFEDNVFFASPWDKPDELRVICEKDVLFNSSVFQGQSRFSGISFQSLAGFDGCVFEHVAVFRNATFGARAMYRTVLFNGYGLFNGTEFCDETRFTNTCFTKGGNFTDVKFRGRTDFSGVYSKGKAVPIYESVWFARSKYGDDETFWRFIKQALQEAGYYQLAGESFYNERCAHFWRKLRGANYDDISTAQKIVRTIKGIRLWPEYIFGRLLFGYGERPIRILAVSMIVIIACAFFYASQYSTVLNRFEAYTDEYSFVDGLYFSTITFTTLGFGDMYPAPEHLPTRLVAMFEALSGACLMALFVVGLSKRYSRG